MERGTDVEIGCIEGSFIAVDRIVPGNAVACSVVKAVNFDFCRAYVERHGAFVLLLL